MKLRPIPTWPTYRLFACCAVLLARQVALAQVASDRIAAVVVYPYVAVNTAAGVDTRIQLSSTLSSAQYVRCFLEETRQHCSVTTAQRCTSTADCPLGQFCTESWSATEYMVQLTSRQPLGWYASSGLSSLPLAQDGMIPPVPGDPFTGALRCLAVDSEGTPQPHNVLIGTGTVETRVDGTDGTYDLASYNAVGIAASPAAANADGVLQLAAGGEYSAGYSVQSLQLLAEGVLDPIGGTDAANTSLILLPLSVDYTSGAAPQASVQLTFYNEFENLVSTSISVNGQYVRDLAHTATNNPAFSIFRAATIGTVSGQLRISAVGASGVLAMALERQVDGSNPLHTSSVTRGFQARTLRATPDRVAFAVSPSPTATETEIPAATDTPTQTETPTRTPTRTATSTASVSPTRSASATASPSASASITPTMSPTASASPTPSITPTATATAAATSTASLTPSVTATAVASETSTATASATPTTTPSAAASETPSLSPTVSPTFTPTRRPCACDCDGDGAVSGAEIGSVIQALLSPVSSPSCARGDANGDAEIALEDLVLCVRRVCEP